MQRIPLSDARLSAALIAVGVPRSGFKVEALRHGKTNQKIASWFLETNDGQEIAELIAQANPAHRSALWRTDPNHPFLAALAGIENHHAVSRMLERKCGPVFGVEPSAHGGIRRLVEGGHQMRRPADVALNSAAHIAAMVAAGFEIEPSACETGVIGMSKESLTFPRLTAPMCVEAANRMIDPRAVALPELPGFAPGRHPFCYALGAVFNLRHIAPMEAEAWKYPTHFFPGPGSRSAIANDAMLRNNTFARELKRHLEGV